MTKIRKLTVAIALTLGLCFAVYADCPVPGIMNTPPCIPDAPARLDDSTANDPAAPEIIGTPPAGTEAPYVEFPSLVEIALNALALF